LIFASARPSSKKHFHPVPERRHVLGGGRAHDVAVGAQHERRRQVFLDGDRHACLVERAIDDGKAAAADLPVDPVIQQLIPAGKGLVSDGHGGNDEGYPRTTLAIRMPSGHRALARVADNAYILRMKAPKVKSEKLPESDVLRR
jgi:hypothetical protein